MNSEGQTSRAFVFFLIMTVFTVVLGAGLLFFESSQSVWQGAEASHTTYMTGQAAALVIVFLFLAGGVIFLFGAARLLARR